MGLLALLKRGKKNVQEAEIQRQRYDLSKVAQLVKPNNGEIITFQITDEEPMVDMSVKQLIRLANTVNADVILDGNTITFICPDANTAEVIRKKWK